MIDFELRGDYIELIALLKATGLSTSGGAAKIDVEEGRVAVDGKVELRKRFKVRRGMRVSFGGETIEVR